MTTTVTTPTPDTARLAFAVEARPRKYGDGRTFHEYRVVVRDGLEVVGVFDGPRLTHATTAVALKAGRARVAELRTRRLYVVRVTDECIDDGEARSCNSCAIAQALWREQERMGLDRFGWDFSVTPYAAFVDAEGISLRNQHDSFAPAVVTGDDGMPDLVTPDGRGAYHVESMMEWAMAWDEWAESRYADEPNDDAPSRPAPCSFVMDLDALKPAKE